MPMNKTQLKAAVRVYNEYFDALKACFVGREEVIELLRYAMIQRQHLLVFGVPGTAKTLFCDVAFGNITGANNFHTELSMFMTEDGVYGPYDVKKMRDDGVLEHRTEGMLPGADLAHLGEFLDASLPLQRSLLGALHERRLTRGKQMIKMPLLTVFCDTNKDPADFMAKNPYAWAVLDRLLFITNFSYLDSSEGITEMVKRFQDGTVLKLEKTLPLEIIHSLSELIVCPPSLIKDELILMKFGEAAHQYRQKRKERMVAEKWKVIFPDISDRRIALASQMMEVGALLDARLDVQPKDLLLPGKVLGTTPEEYELWVGIAEQKIEEIKEIKSQQLDHAQLIAINSLIEQAEALTADDPKLAADRLRELQDQLDQLVPENEVVSQKKGEAEEHLSGLREHIREAALEIWGLK